MTLHDDFQINWQLMAKFLNRDEKGLTKTPEQWEQVNKKVFL